MEIIEFGVGDEVHHIPSGENWLLLEVRGEYVVPAGWPRCQAKTSDCVLVKRDDGRLGRLRKPRS